MTSFVTRTVVIGDVMMCSAGAFVTALVRSTGAAGAAVALPPKAMADAITVAVAPDRTRRNLFGTRPRPPWR
ncbi:hypothetical protein ACFY7O_23315 [Streptomyces californicus]|uniref:hypothetical protein n=1 Tax=Streptomyces californicus TaxID=67351 RepID=UPI0036A751A3